MTKIDNSKIFHEGSYADVTLTVPAATTYKAGLVLGRNADGDLTAFDSTVTGSTPLYILAQTVVNEGDAADEFPLVRAFEEGVVDAAKLIFKNESDATNEEVLDALKTNGYKLRNVGDLVSDSSLA